jgi:glycosyltransferase involved in cell wall biosynthesis
VNILYITQYFPPETGAGASRANEMATHLSKRGHRVVVLTSFPSYLTGVIPSQYRRKLYYRDKLNDIDIIRVWTYPSLHHSVLSRILNYLSFCFSAIIAGLFIGKKDIVYASSPPLLVGLAGSLISFCKSSKFIFEIRDIWPDAAIIIGELKNKLIIKVAKTLEKICYARANVLVPVSKGIYVYLNDRSIPSSKLNLIENGVNPEVYYPQYHYNIRKHLNLNDKFLVLYAGLHGLIAGMDTLIETARVLQKQEDIFFLFIGDGIEKTRMISKANEYSLSNIKFLNSFQENDLSQYIASTDVGVATVKKEEFLSYAVPAKMFTYMACGRPVILGAWGDPEEILKKADAGICVEPEDPDALANAILELYKNRELCEKYGKNGRSFVVEHYTRRMQADKLEKVLKGLISE